MTVEFDELVGSMYEAAGEPASWSRVCSDLAEFTGAFGVYLFYWNKTDPGYSFSAPSERLNPEANELYGTHYYALDDALRLLPQTPIGQPYLCQDHFDANYVRQS